MVRLRRGVSEVCVCGTMDGEDGRVSEGRASGRAVDGGLARGEDKAR